MTGPQAPIGSYFELPADHLCTGNGYHVPPRAWLLQSGRQAIAAVVRSLADRTDKRVRVPEYLCESMITPFTTQGWDVLTYPLDGELELQPEATDLDDGELWLLAPYFGRHLNSDVSAWAEARAANGAPTLLDQTHCVLSPDPTPTTFTVASLRKTLPIPEGGYVDGIDALSLPTTSSFDIAALTYAAASMKTHALKCHHSPAAAHKTFAEGERMVELSSAPAPMSPTSRDVMARLDTDALVERRSSNARILARELETIEGIRPLRGIVESIAPAYLACTVRDAASLQSELARASIYCPIHWPPTDLIHNRRWRSDVISIPVDHRYHTKDMLRLSERIRAVILERDL